MPFIRKAPSVILRVLPLTDCPLHNVLHSPHDYPLYYDSLYYPQFHEAIFDNPASVCIWLSHQFDAHAESCVSCTVCSPFSEFHVEYSADISLVTCGNTCMTLSRMDIESSTFSICGAVHCLCSSSCTSDDWSATALVVRSQKPAWLYRDDEYVTQALDTLSLSELQCVAHALPAASVGPHH